MHLVLDLDGTLVSESRCPQLDWLPEARPGLPEFMAYCFTAFDTVSIWTAAKPEWFQFVNERLLKSYRFHTVFTAEKCVRHFKPLRKMWKNGKTKHNTVVIDNNPSTYARNYGNAVPIATFYAGMSYPGDRELFHIVPFLEKVRQYHQLHGTVRSMDKRHWSTVQLVHTAVTGALPTPHYVDSPDCHDYQAQLLWAVKDTLYIQKEVTVCCDCMCHEPAYLGDIRSVTTKIQHKRHILANRWKVASLFTTQPIKITLLGPVSTAAAMINEHYSSYKDMLMDIAAAQNVELLHLVENGCQNIQISEPLMTTQHISIIQRVFQDVKAVCWLHVCTISPLLAIELDSLSCVSVVSMDNWSAQVLCFFTRAVVSLGVADCHSTESSIVCHAVAALQHLPQGRLILATHCDLSHLSWKQVSKTLGILTAAASLINL